MAVIQYSERGEMLRWSEFIDTFGDIWQAAREDPGPLITLMLL